MGRGFSNHSVNIILEKKRNKFELLKACGCNVSFNFQNEELLIEYPNGEIINIFEDTSKIRFEYKSDEKREEYKTFYKKIFPMEGIRKTSHENKDGSTNERKEPRCEPSDFIKNAYLRNKLMEHAWMEYKDFFQKLSEDIIINFQ